IPANGFGSGGPKLSVTPTHAALSYAVPLPPIQVGVMSLQHATFGAGLTLPFMDGRPLVDFTFAERSHPFLLTVGVFGGTGFLHVQLNTKEVLLIEGAFEFGGAFALDLGVASGGVFLVAGIYFKKTEAKAELSGFVRCSGEFVVLGYV